MFQTNSEGSYYPALRTYRKYEDGTGSKIIWLSNLTRTIEDVMKSSVSCLASGKNLQHDIPKHKKGKLNTLHEPGQKTRG